MRIFFLCISCLFLLSAQAQNEFSLEEAVAYGIKNNNAVKQELLDIQDADKQIREFLATGLPQINGTATWTRNLNLAGSPIPAGSFDPGDPDVGRLPFPAEDQFVAFGTKHNTNAGLSASALLFDGSFLVGLKANRLYKALRQKEIKVTEEQVAYNIHSAYITALVAKANIGVLENNINNLTKTLNETKQIYENGFAEKLDVDRLDLSLATLAVEKQKAEGLFETTKNILKFSMGYDMADDITLSQSINELVLTSAWSDSLLLSNINVANRSEYEVLQTTSELLDLNVKQINAQYLPSLSAFGNYNRLQQGNQFFQGDWIPVSAFGVTLNVPIYDAGDKAAKKARANIAIEKHQLNMDDFNRATTLEIENAKIGFDNAIKTWESTSDNQTLAEHIYETTQIKYREGVGSSVEVTQAESDLYRAQGNYINAWYELLIAKTDLEKALGILKY